MEKDVGHDDRAFRVRIADEVHTALHVGRGKVLEASAEVRRPQAESEIAQTDIVAAGKTGYTFGCGVLSWPLPDGNRNVGPDTELYSAAI